MSEIHKLFQDTQHRPFPLPAGRWIYYQEWNHALFLHWKIPMEILRPLVPEGLCLDTFQGDAYVSLVAFTMQKIRPRNLPAVQYISDFAEINLRTYIDQDGRKGVYFLNIEAEKFLSAWIAKKLSGLPYEKSDMSRTAHSFRSENHAKNFHFNTDFHVKTPIISKTELDLWLTERYCLYIDQGSHIYRYDIHHKEWELKQVDLKYLELSYHIKDLHLINDPVLWHYSDGVQVLAWGRERVMQ